MDVNIQINSPILVTGESFKVRYRELPSGLFSAPQTEDNDPFTITGLSVGQYELEVVVVKGDIECPAVLQQFKVVSDFECETFTAEITANANYTLYNLEIDYPFPITDPACGWEIQIIGNNVNKTVTYKQLPSPPLVLSVPNEGLLVRVYGNICNGDRTLCFEGDVNPVPPPPCTGVTIVGTPTITPMPFPSNQYRIDFTITQSSPATTAWSINYQQFPSPPYQLPGIPNIGTSAFTVSPLQVTYNIVVDPTFDAETRFINYNVRFVDKCGNVLVFTVSYQRF